MTKNIERLCSFFRWWVLILRLSEVTPELTEREKAMLRYRLDGQKTLEWIGREFGISHKRAGQIIQIALEKIEGHWGHRFQKAVEAIKEIEEELLFGGAAGQ
jgi:DNA-binding CsgD family transcriptional regulator